MKAMFVCVSPDTLVMIALWKVCIHSIYTIIIIVNFMHQCIIMYFLFILKCMMFVCIVEYFCTLHTPMHMCFNYFMMV